MKIMFSFLPWIRNIIHPKRRANLFVVKYRLYMI